MDIIRFAISNPVKVAVGVLLLVLFGLLALLNIPIQLVPNVDQLVITVETNWTGRSPQEVEQEILEPQEEKLKRVSNLKKMTAIARQGTGEITLQFYLGTDITRALAEVSDKVREVADYPEDVDNPIISAADIASDRAVAWMTMSSSDPDFDIEALRDLCEERIRPRLESVDGIARVNVFGGRDREVQVQVDPKLMAQRGITFKQLRDALRGENVNVSAGDLPHGKIDVRIRTVGQYDNMDNIMRTVVADTDAGPVRVRDIGQVKMALIKPIRFVRSRGKPAIAFNAVRETGSNVIEIMDELKLRIKEVNEIILPQIDPSLKITQVYDETIYIDDALALVRNNLWVGSILAVVILLLFLRSFRPTVVVAMAIPISVVGTFVAMMAFGRNINVISLAGLSFAVGMVVDNAIVVLENIDRHLAMGKPPRQAAYDAAREVWGAILASTLTTLAVFLPVVFMREEAGQLFRDIALATCAAVTLSLIISITVIPPAAARFLKPKRESKWAISKIIRNLFGLASVLDYITGSFAQLIHTLTGRKIHAIVLRIVIIAAFMLTAVLGALWLKPPTTYLPTGNRNLVIGVMQTPPSYSIEQNRYIGDRVEAQVRPFFAFDGKVKDPSTLPKIIHPFTGQEVIPPPIENFFFVVRRGTVFMGAGSSDKERVKNLEALLMSSMNSIPGSRGFAFQASIFGRGLGGTNSIAVEVSGDNLDELRSSTLAIMKQLMTKFPIVRPDPQNFNLPGPELRLVNDPVRAADLGIDVAELGLTARVLIDGLKVGDYRLGGETVDLKIVRRPGYDVTPETLGMVPLAFHAPNGEHGVVPLESAAKFVWADAPQQINRIWERRSITLTVTPPAEIPLEVAVEQVRAMVPPLRQSGQIAPGINVTPAGTADKLQQVRHAMLGQWTGFNTKSLISIFTSRLVLALIITYLLMAALFESFLYPFVIMFSVPLALVGGFLGLSIVHSIDPNQQLDVLTMLGFVILIGIVVNNAILIVHQALNFMKGHGEGAGGDLEGKALGHREAIREAVRTRMRPVMMTTMTSVFGMAPLVLSRFVSIWGSGGAGSELYTGLGSVVIGGLIVSTFFTLLVVPLVFSLTLDAKAVVARLLGKEEEEPEAEKTKAETKIDTPNVVS